MRIIGAYKYLEQLIDKKISGIHTAYLAQVLSVSGSTAKIQPLGLYQNEDGTTSKQSVLTQVPISERAKNYMYYTQNNVGYLKEAPIQAGNIVVCICCEQNISEAKRGVNALPPAGRFSMSDSIIIGVL